jgi:NAD(P)-dependent dehydrogenase (short-subunit alcohol dehydrogenase family)
MIPAHGDVPHHGNGDWMAGKHLLITGASSGIGREVAMEMMGRCARLTLVARNRDGALHGLARDLCQVVARRSAQNAAQARTQVGFYAIDVRDADAAASLVTRTYDERSQIDAFLNCAGGTHVCAPLARMSVPDIEEVFDVNAKAPIIWLKELLPRMKRNPDPAGAGKRAHVVMLSSRSGERGLPNLSVYAAAKGSLDRLIESVRAEYAASRIAFTVVCPGAIDTSFTRHWPRKRQASYRAVSMPVGAAVQPIIAALNAEFAVNRISYESIEQWLGEPGVLEGEPDAVPAD